MIRITTTVLDNMYVDLDYTAVNNQRAQLKQLRENVTNIPVGQRATKYRFETIYVTYVVYTITIPGIDDCVVPLCSKASEAFVGC